MRLRYTGCEKEFVSVSLKSAVYAKRLAHNLAHNISLLYASIDCHNNASQLPNQNNHLRHDALHNDPLNDTKNHIISSPLDLPVTLKN